MYGLNHVRPLLSAAAYPKRSLRLNPPIRHFPLLTHFSRRPPTPAEIEDSLSVSEGDRNQISGEDENQIPIVEDRIEYERKVLPPELRPWNVVALTCDSAAPGGICDVYLVGTIHGSEKSFREVEAVIKFLQPQIVFLEFCPHFRFLLRGGIADGAEFAVAYEEARKYGGEVICGDRPINITLKRIWAKMPLWQKTFVLPILLLRLLTISDAEKEMVENWGADQVEGANLKMQSSVPIIAETIVHERDQYMAAKLLAVARKHNSVVAVVGKGHLAGIRKNWKQPVDMEEILHAPTLIIPKLVGVAIIGGIIFIKMS